MLEVMCYENCQSPFFMLYEPQEMAKNAAETGLELFEINFLLVFL